MSHADLQQSKTSCRFVFRRLSLSPIPLLFAAMLVAMVSSNLARNREISKATNSGNIYAASQHGDLGEGQSAAQGPP